MIEVGEGDGQKYPEIIRTNKKIHWKLPQSCRERLGSYELYIGTNTDGCGTGRSPNKLYILVATVASSPNCASMSAPEATRTTHPMQTQSTGTPQTKSACKILTSNEFKMLKVDFYNGIRYN